jgi:hypothetical protein
MSMALQDVIPVMNLIKEMREENILVICTKPYIYCELIQALELIECID